MIFFVLFSLIRTFVGKIEVMALNLNKNLKLYYSIKEVAEMFGVNESTLRYWELEFPYLKPKTSGPAKPKTARESRLQAYHRRRNGSAEDLFLSLLLQAF